MYQQLTKKFLSIAVQLPTIAVHKKISIAVHKKTSVAVHKKTSCSALSMLSSVSQRPHVIRWLFPFDDAKLLHSARALSVSGRLRPVSASFGRISPFPSLCSYRSMPYCSAIYLTATGGSSLSRGLTPSMASSSLWRESHLCRVFIDTPAAWASSLLVMDFMIRYLMFIYWEL